METPLLMHLSRASMYSSSRRRQDNSSELDVFDASRYFSGCIGGVSIGFGYNIGSVSSHNPIAMKKGLEMIASFPCQKLEEKKCKQPVSPGRKFATFLNSLFQKTPSKKKKKKHSSLEKAVDRSNGERKESFEHIGKNQAKGFKSFHSTFGEKKWHLIRKNGHDKFVVKKREEDGMIEKEERDDEDNVDYMSDSSSDLFELKSYDFSCGMPAYQASNAGLMKRGAPVFATAAC